MARAGITKADVFEVADLLRQQGVDVTPTAVRERTGTGSYTTLKRYLDEWREANPPPAQDIPEMPDTVRHATRQIWVLAISHSEQRIAAERAALDAERKVFERERQELEHEIARLEQVGDDLQRQLAEATKEAEQEKQKTAKLEAKEAQLTERGMQWKERAEYAEAKNTQLENELLKIARAER